MLNIAYLNIAPNAGVYRFILIDCALTGPTFSSTFCRAPLPPSGAFKGESTQNINDPIQGLFKTNKNNTWEEMLNYHSRVSLDRLFSSKSK